MEKAFSFVGVQPPEFSLQEAAAVAEEIFGVRGTPALLWGERDRNVRLSPPEDGSADHSGFVLKISNDREDPAALEFQIAALQHLVSVSPRLPLPQIKAALDGRAIARVTSRSGRQHLVHMLGLLPGVPLAEVGGDSRALLAAGALAGKAALGLRGFFHPAAGRDMFWDIRQLGRLAAHAPGIADAAVRRAVTGHIAFFDAEVRPALEGLRAQVVHYDSTPANLLVDPEDPARITGLIDFGDAIHAPLAQDVAVAAIELGGSRPDAVEAAATVVRGYDSACALEEAEVDLLYDLMLTRVVLGLLIGVTRVSDTADSSGDLDYSQIYIPVLDKLLTAGRDRTRAALRAACRFPTYCPPRPLPAGTNRAFTENLIARRHAVLGKSLSLSYDMPLHTLRGEGVWLQDVDGRRYLDCYNNVPHVGHCHPHVVKALSRQAAALNTNTRYLYESIVEYAERLGALLPGDLSVCLFVNSGSEANDLALRMAKVCSGQDGALVMQGAYHGITSEIYALSPSNDWGRGDGANRAHASQIRSDIALLQNPDTLRGPYGADAPDVAEKYAADADGAIADLAGAGHPAGAFMIDSAFATSGILDVPRGYLGGVARRVRAAGGLIIADEVQYGFGRSGARMWGFENHEVVPDFVTLGKPIGNGIALGAVVTTPQILERFTRSTDVFSTFGGNPVACAAGLAVLEVIEREDLLANARDTGAYLIAGLRDAARGSDRIAEVRGQGLFVGVDVVRDRESLAPDSAECDRIKNHLRDNGVLVGSEGIGGNILKIRPPMVFQRAHADRLIDAFGKAISEK